MAMEPLYPTPYTWKRFLGRVTPFILILALPVLVVIFRDGIKGNPKPLNVVLRLVCSVLPWRE
jgi:hypothetical protein